MKPKFGRQGLHAVFFGLVAQLVAVPDVPGPDGVFELLCPRSGVDALEELCGVVHVVTGVGPVRRPGSWIVEEGLVKGGGQLGAHIAQAVDLCVFAQAATCRAGQHPSRSLARLGQHRHHHIHGR